jgi:hypothetical protein
MTIADFQTRLEELEHELSRVEATFGEILGEAFPEFPGLGASRSEIDSWTGDHDRRTRRLVSLMEVRADLVKRIQALVDQAGR